MDELLSSTQWPPRPQCGFVSASIHSTSDDRQLFALMSLYKNHCLFTHFIVSLLSREHDWRRSLSLLDWMHDWARYTPFVFAYNVALRNVLRAKQWEVAHDCSTKYATELSPPLNILIPLSSLSSSRRVSSTTHCPGFRRWSTIEFGLVHQFD